MTRHGAIRICTAPDCQARAVANGLCAKHTMRLRRHGDLNKVGRAGRPNTNREKREMLPVISDRTYARFRRALRLARAFDIDIKPILGRYSRANGSVNFAAIERVVENTAATMLAETMTPS